MFDSLILGLLLSASIGLLAWRRGSLSSDGVVGAVIMGTLAFMAGVGWAATLILFFVSSSILSKLQNPQKQAAREQFSKGERRDLRQVLANGGLGAILAILFILLDEASLWAAYLGALAAVNADTWATEIGTLRGGNPRLITTRRLVEAGRSGGVTAVGLLGALLGALTIGVVGTLFSTKGDAWAALLVTVTLAGFAGGLIDSLLGATIQAQYFCADTGRITERTVCPDGSSPTLQSGSAWINNDVVNFTASACGALLGFGVISLL